MWNPKGGELFYQSPTAVMSAQIADGRAAGPVISLFDHPMDERMNRDWSVSPDGQRFLTVEPSSALQINVITNWFEELRRLVPTKKN